MFYIVCLGNPGAQYAKTRHNIGFVVGDRLAAAADLPPPTHSKKYTGRVSVGTVAGLPVTLFYPETFMNNAGRAVRLVLPRDASPAQLVVVYDDVDLPVGALKVSFGNGAGGHNGVASVIAALGTKDFVRVRVGVARVSHETGQVVRPAGDELAAFVLGTFTADERAVLETFLPTVVEAVEVVVRDGRETAMNRFN